MLNIIHKISGKILIILLSVILLSCNGQKQHSEQLQVNSNKVEKVKKHEKNADTIRLSNDIDSVTVLCLMFGEDQNKSFRLYFSDMDFYGVFFHDHDKKNKEFPVQPLETRNQFVNYINKFYIEKEKIIFSKKKTGYIRTINGYPTIIVKLFRKGDLILEQENEIGSETHKVEYNPKFIEFYEFLDGLVTEN